MVIGGGDEANITNTVVTAKSSSVLNLDTQGSTFKDSSNLCSTGLTCYGQDFIYYKAPGANINWDVQIYCSGSPYPSTTHPTPSPPITCQ